MKKLDKYQSLNLDVITYVKNKDSQSEVLFKLITHLDEHGSSLISTNQAFK
jgi:hypothetical protein